MEISHFKPTFKIKHYERLNIYTQTHTHTLCIGGQSWPNGRRDRLVTQRSQVRVSCPAGIVVGGVKTSALWHPQFHDWGETLEQGTEPTTAPWVPIALGVCVCVCTWMGQIQSTNSEYGSLYWPHVTSFPITATKIAKYVDMAIKKKLLLLYFWYLG